MLETEYELTLEDEIDSLEIDRDYVAQLPLSYWQYSYIPPLMFLSIDIPNIFICLTTDVAFYNDFDGISIFTTLLNLFFGISLMPQVQARLPWRNSFAKSNVKKSWRDNPGQIKLRNITLSDTKFSINKTDSYPILGEETKVSSYSWDKLRRYFEGDRGFYLDFSESDRYFIPKRIFADQEETNRFRQMLSNSRI